MGHSVVARAIAEALRRGMRPIFSPRRPSRHWAPQKVGRDQSRRPRSMIFTLLRGFELNFLSRQRFTRGSRKRHWA